MSRACQKIDHCGTNVTPYWKGQAVKNNLSWLDFHLDLHINFSILLVSVCLLETSLHADACTLVMLLPDMMICTDNHFNQIQILVYRKLSFIDPGLNLTCHYYHIQLHQLVLCRTIRLLSLTKKRPVITTLTNSLHWNVLSSMSNCLYSLNKLQLFTLAIELQNVKATLMKGLIPVKDAKF